MKKRTKHFNPTDVLKRKQLLSAKNTPPNDTAHISLTLDTRCKFTCFLKEKEGRGACCHTSGNRAKRHLLVWQDDVFRSIVYQREKTGGGAADDGGGGAHVLSRSISEKITHNKSIYNLRRRQNRCDSHVEGSDRVCFVVFHLPPPPHTMGGPS